MVFGAFSARVLVVAAYLMAAILPVVVANAGRPLPDAQHAQMMAAAGHTMPMEDVRTNDNEARMLLCQQHCLVAVATLPAQVRMTENWVVLSDVIPIADWQVASFAKPPPGPPPKVAVI